MNDILRKIGLCGIVPVVALEDDGKAVQLCRALYNGGINTVEITFRTDAALKSIENVTREMPEMLVGAGTVLSVPMARDAVRAGAQFIVSPGFNPEVVRYCTENKITVIPGCATCSEIEQALSFGLGTVKFFPAEAMGGASAVKAFSAPYKMMSFMPTGGINEDNLLDYLKIPSVLACGGSFMVKPQLINDGNYDEITRLTYNAVAKMHGFTLKHVGINCVSSDECDFVSDALCRFTMTKPDNRGGAVFSGTLFEVMRSPYLGKNGHIAIGCNFPDRAFDRLCRLGFSPDEKTAAYDEKGKLKIIYFKNDFSGFVLHIVKN